MISGWHNEFYVNLFEEEDRASELSRRYGLQRRIEEYDLIGLFNWDDFLMADSNGILYTIPTLPIRRQYLKRLDVVFDLARIREDPVIGSGIKWYIQPLIFSGKADAKDNVIWITVDQHIDVVAFWNEKYEELTASR